MRYITCRECGGTGDTMVKVSDGEYRHQSKASCRAECARRKLSEKALPKSEILAARRPLILPPRSGITVFPSRGI